MLPSLMLAIASHGRGKVGLSPLDNRGTLVGVTPAVAHDRGQLVSHSPRMTHTVSPRRT